MPLVQQQLLLMILAAFVTACSSLGGMQQQFTVCDYDRAWEAALDAAKDRAIRTEDKEAGRIVTSWEEISMPGRTYGAMKRQIADSKDRSRISLTVRRLDDVTQISFVEQRQQWAFRGGNKFMGWVPSPPSRAVMRNVRESLDAKLQERGCSLS